MLFSAPPQEKESTSWKQAGGWLAFVYLTIPFARSIQQLVYEHGRKELFLWGTLLVLAAAGGWLVRAARKKQWTARPAQLAVLAGIGAGLAALAGSLRRHPEEAFHLVQYGVLGLLLFRALSHRLRDPSVYAAGFLAGSAAGIGDELIQWAVPQRVFDFRDVGINVLAVALVQVALAAGIRPAFIRPPRSRAGLRIVRNLALLNLLLLAAGLCHLWPARTPPAPEPLKVVFFADVHARTEWETPEALARAAEAINAQQAGLIICGGDMITEGMSCSPARAAPRWQVYRAMHAALRPEPVVVIGNHDLVGVRPDDGSPPVSDPRASVRAELELEQTYRSFDLKGYHFILLDSIGIVPGKRGYRGFIDPEQLEWLRRDLARVDHNTPIVVVSHVPLLVRDPREPKDPARPGAAHTRVVNAGELLAAFRGHRILAVLQGHRHVEQVFTWRNIPFITGGAICGEWWRGPHKGTPMGFGVLQLHPDRVEWEYLTYGWVPRRPPDQ